MVPVLRVFFVAALLLSGVAPALAQGYPNPPVRVVVGFPAGGPTAIARLVAQKLSDSLGQQFFVENTYEYPLLPGVDAPEGLPELESLINPELDLSDLESLEQTQELLAQYGLL